MAERASWLMICVRRMSHLPSEGLQACWRRRASSCVLRHVDWVPGHRHEPRSLVALVARNGRAEHHGCSVLAKRSFDDLKSMAKGMGFRHVESGPLVRSSYHAHAQLQ